MRSNCRPHVYAEYLSGPVRFQLRGHVFDKFEESS